KENITPAGSSSHKPPMEMGNFCSTPLRSKCHKRKLPFRAWTPFSKRVKYTSVPQDEDGGIDGEAAPNDTSTLFPVPERGRANGGNGAAAAAGGGGGGGENESPPSLHRSNAIRRARSHSHTSSISPVPSLRLRVRNTTPPPPRPTSIVPTLMLNRTPSTNQTSLSRSTALTSSTGPTAPTSPASPAFPPFTPNNTGTCISTRFRDIMHQQQLQREGSSQRPRTLYVVDGEVVGGEGGGVGGEESPRLELRWIDALRAPGAGGFRTVVDVVEERRSGRLVVVNDVVGEGRAQNGNQDGESGGGAQRQRPMLQRDAASSPLVGRVGDENGNAAPTTNGAGDKGGEQQPSPHLFIPASGPPTQRAHEESTEERKQKNQQQQQQFLTPIRRKPVPRSHKPPPALTDGSSPCSSVDNESPCPISYQRRRAPMVRPPIPRFEMENGNGMVTEKELLDEVADARRIVEGRYAGGEDEEVDRKKDKEVDGKKDGLGNENGKEVGMKMEKQKGKGERGEKKVEEEDKQIDWFFVDDFGGLKYKRGVIMTGID
ncbi:MAG: hypothetical protein Q9216_005690, partial [Gyalolechia sp. 2 TL-2023]